MGISVIELTFIPTTDIKDAVETAVKVCFESNQKVHFKFNGIHVSLDYDRIVYNLVSNKIDDYNRNLQQNRRNKE